MEKTKRLLALGGVILLAGMYLSTLVFALIRSEWAYTLFQASVLCTITVPVMLYGYILVYRVLKTKNEELNTPDPDKGSSAPDRKKENPQS